MLHNDALWIDAQVRPAPVWLADMGFGRCYGCLSVNEVGKGEDETGFGSRQGSPQPACLLATAVFLIGDLENIDLHSAPPCLPNLWPSFGVRLVPS